MFKILLCCSSGLTTSRLVTSMKEEANKAGKAVMIWAVAESAIEQSWADADCVLVAPQSINALSKIKEMVNDSIPVEVIDDEYFSRVDGKSVLNEALSLIKR